MQANQNSTFENTFKLANNHFHLVRHLAASCVVVDHAFIINGHHHALAYVGSKTSLGMLGIAIFFVLSGALVTASFLSCRSPLDFIQRRLQRIYPAYLVCLLITALILCPIVACYLSSEPQTLHSYLTTPPTPLTYVFSNLAVVQFQNRIGNVFASHPEAYSVNGSLWSIPWEVLCYAGVFLLGVSGILRDRRWLVLLLLSLAVLNVAVFPSGSIFGRYYLNGNITMLPIYFLSGAIFFLFRQNIPRHSFAIHIAWISYLVLAYSNSLLASLILPYAIFGLAHRHYAAQSNDAKLPDLSYGIYIYGFPIQQSIFALVGDRLSLTTQLLLAIAFILPMAAFSWHFVEKRWMMRRASAVRSLNTQPI